MICPRCERSHRWTGLCDECLEAASDALGSVGRMDNHTRKYRPVLTIAAVVLGVLFFFALLMATTEPETAEAHTPDPRACNLVWQNAPEGQKYAAKRRCQKMQWRHRCVDHNRPVPYGVTVKGSRAGTNQRHVIGWIVNEALDRNLPRYMAAAALVATTQEAEARELTYGHGTSLGPFQLISSHGTAAQRISVEFSGNWFYNGAMKVVRAEGAMAPDKLAQAVERSGHPGAYRQWIPEAGRNLNLILGSCHLRR